MFLHLAFLILLQELRGVCSVSTWTTQSSKRHILLWYVDRLFHLIKEKCIREAEKFSSDFDKLSALSLKDWIWQTLWLDLSFVFTLVPSALLWIICCFLCKILSHSQHCFNRWQKEQTYWITKQCTWMLYTLALVSFLWNAATKLDSNAFSFAMNHTSQTRRSVVTPVQVVGRKPALFSKLCDRP